MCRENGKNRIKGLIIDILVFGGWRIVRSHRGGISQYTKELFDMKIKVVSPGGPYRSQSSAESNPLSLETSEASSSFSTLFMEVVMFLRLVVVVLIDHFELKLLWAAGTEL